MTLFIRYNRPFLSIMPKPKSTISEKQKVSQAKSTQTNNFFSQIVHIIVEAASRMALNDTCLLVFTPLSNHLTNIRLEKNFWFLSWAYYFSSGSLAMWEANSESPVNRPVWQGTKVCRRSHSTLGDRYFLLQTNLQMRLQPWLMPGLPSGERPWARGS